MASALYAVKKSADGLTLEFEFSSGKTTSRKSIQFAKNGYLSQVSTEVTENAVPVPHQVAWRGGFGDMAVPNATSNQRTTHYDVQAQKLIVKAASDAKDGPFTTAGTFSFAGVEDTYFAAVFLPSGNGATEIQTFGDAVANAFEQKETPRVGAAVGGEGRNRFAFFVGPKDLDKIGRAHV